METTFYEDSSTRYGRGAEGNGGGGRVMKRPSTLDLGVSSKKMRGPTSLLSSPDLHMLKLESPELEKLIIQQHGLVASSQPCMYPSNNHHNNNKSDDRDGLQQYTTRDFQDALNGMPQQQQNNNMHLYPQHPTPDMMIQTSMASMVDNYGYQPQPLSTININCNPMVSSAAMVSSTTSANCYPPSSYYGMEAPISIKEEPQTVPSCTSPPRSPIDMEDQERMKLERKRLRNRIAASKCRRRKLERIARLEDKVAHLKSENAELSGHVTRLREHVCALKQQVMDHVRNGCEILVSSTSYAPTTSSSYCGEDL